jgi:AraC-like DNA-binding protein
VPKLGWGTRKAYHFARQFKNATRLPPHQYLILRRVERAKQLLQAGSGLSLAEVAAHSGFSDQSHLSRHFKRLVGVSPAAIPGARKIRLRRASTAKKRRSSSLTIPQEQRGRRVRPAGKG